ncbi:MAG: hypothetical protein Q8L94_13205 [Parvibaculum sp.]|uniref:hypothetical protein n=2 Tax=Parvibaculum sp. TaxID=2024848 RepID=UPI00272F1CCD|nr:hypothetical protein [Parvibaculum sp.]MDP1628074.1 hypothetical protein [Parvibaculum sp.]MDP3328540.1 hypothetical protein [Parvibaculum sp.]
MNMSKYAPAYLATIFATVVVCGLLAFGFNAAVDPMWYFGGNKLGTVNYAFNERLSKTNRFLADPERYDCLIFGDSRVTLLPEDKIEGYRCFNFAFSAGKAEEAVAFARYVGARGFKPRLVIMGVPAAAFRERIGGVNIPPFIKEGGAPKSPFLTYLSLDAVSMSKQTLFGVSPLDRVYDRNFNCNVAPGAPAYDPRVPLRDLMAGKFNAPQRVRFYDDMRKIFPDAELVGYVPPISAWAIKSYDDAGWLGDYVHVLHAASEKFDRFLDYGVPSALTIDTANTYDGTHYSEPANAAVARSLLSGGLPDTLNVKALSSRQMGDIYRQRLGSYNSELRAGLAD